jgi:tRNA nucleotidyltransferase (CCA-adding enzyme)
VASQARKDRAAAYLVGGAVRDLVSGRPLRDLDFAIEGDAGDFARRWAEGPGRRLVASSQFGTAEVEAGRPGLALRVDFASARAETYVRPAALPETSPTGIESDLARRDFTVNAMAVPLTGPRRGELLDPHEGLRDLARRRLRFLHPRSAFDDPTRAFRVARYAARLHFSVEPATVRAIRDAVASGAFAPLSGDRLRREIFLLFEEVRPDLAVREMSRLGLVGAVSRALRSGRDTVSRLRRLGSLFSRRTPSRAVAALLCWACDLSDRERLDLSRRLNLDREAARRLGEIGAALSIARECLAPKGSPGRLAFQSRAWTEETSLAVASALAPRKGKKLLAARARARRLRVSLTGDRLRAFGIRPGPAIGRALEETWKARFENRIARGEELAFALKEASR